MIYYKHKLNNDIYAYETEAERNEYGTTELVKMTPAEIDAHLNPKPTTEQLSAQARSKRDSLLRATDWTQVPDAPVIQSDWATYRQALRDITLQDGFPENINWPTEP